MTQGAAYPPPGDDQRRGAGVWSWARPIAIGALLAFVLLILLAGLLNDLLPGSGNGGVITGPTPPAPTTSVLPTQTETPVATPTDTTGGGGGGTGGGGGGTGGTGGGGGSNNPGGGSGGGGGGGSTKSPTPTQTPTTPEPTAPPTQTPTSPATPPVPPVGPDRCTVYPNPGYCATRQQLFATVVPGSLSLDNGLAGPQIGGTASLVKLAPGGTDGPSLSGPIKPILVTDARGSAVSGWTVRASVAWPGGLPDGVLVTVSPWCLNANLQSAPGLITGAPNQSLAEPVTMCSKDSQVGATGSTGGQYAIGATVSLSTWIGEPVPATSVLVTLTMGS